MDASAYLRKKKHMLHYANHLTLSGNTATNAHRAGGGLHMSIVEGAIHMEVEQKEKIVAKYNAPVSIPTPVEAPAEVVVVPSPPVEVPAEVIVEPTPAPSPPVEVPAEVVVEPTPVPVEAPVEVPAVVPAEVVVEPTPVPSPPVEVPAETSAEAEAEGTSF